MTQLLEILAIVLPVFLVVVLGYGIKRTSLVDANFLFHLNKIVYYIALPLLLFYKISTAQFDTSFNGAQVLAMGLTIVLCFLLSYGFGVAMKYPPEIKGTMSQCAFRGNFAYIGLAIVFNGYGENGLATAGILLGCIVPLLNFLSIVALLLPQRENRDVEFSFLGQILHNPLIIASFLGVIWSYFHLPIPVILDKALHIVTGMALPLALISIGASFSVKKLRGDLTKGCIATCMKLVLMPILAAGIFLLFGVDGQNLAIGVLFAATPTATAAYIFSQQMKGDAELSGVIIMLTTLLSVFSYTVIFMIFRYYGI